jgi:hypothetical protein
LGLPNWQMTQKTAFDLHNRTGSDVFIAASTTAGRGWNREIQRRSRVDPPRLASHASLSSAKFDRHALRRLRPPAAPAVGGPLLARDARDEVGRW